MEEQLYLLAVGLSLDEKIEKAIANLREYEREALRRDPENGYYLCDSYGKDSCVILDLAKRAGVKFKAHHNLTTLDPPELIRFGREHHANTIVHKPKVSMLTRVHNSPNRGAPTRLKRWCCSEYKESAGRGTVMIFGVRAAESARRAANWKTWQPCMLGGKRGDTVNGWILNPILYWTNQDVWNYIHANNIPYCSLYDEGFKRLGCVGCPMAGDGRKREFERWPKIGAAWKRAIIKFYDKWHDVPLQRPRTLPDGTITSKRWFDMKENINSGEDLWHWWMEDLPEPQDDGCQMGLF